MPKQEQIKFLNNIIRLGFEEAVALIDTTELDEHTNEVLSRYAHYREAVINLISQEVIEELEPESIL